MNIFTEAAKLEEQNCPFAMAQIVDSRGSTPISANLRVEPSEECDASVPR
ncbi:NAD(P)-binding Rossman fold [Escherichia coli]|nr:NAD(P)-binding Rossman fold [Escherichia coli]